MPAFSTFRKNYVVLLILFTGCFVLMAAGNADPENEVPYPEGYRGWTHVKSVLAQKVEPLGFHHIYGNARAIEGYKSGKFANGSVLVFDVIAATGNDSLIVEGKRKLIDVMVRNSKRYSATGGWGYEEFKGDSKTERNVRSLAAKACYSCHAHQKTNDNVFSKLRDQS